MRLTALVLAVAVVALLPAAARAGAPDAVASASCAKQTKALKKFKRGTASAADGTIDVDYSRFDLSGDGYTGFTFTGVANVDASDDGGGGDASAYMERRFEVNETLFIRLHATLQGQDPEETAGSISLGATDAQNPPIKMDTFSSKTFTSQLSPGDYTLIAEVSCSPGNAGGPCDGSFDVDLDAGDFITPP